MVPEASRSADFYLAGRRVRELVDENHLVRHPPFGDLAREELEDLGLVHVGARPAHCNQERPLAPLRVRSRDHGCFRQSRMTDRGVLERDRADPLAARAHHVLRPISDVHVPVRVDRGDVAGREPARLIERLVRGSLVAKIPRCDPGAARVQHARARAVVGQPPAPVVDDLNSTPQMAAPASA